MSKPSPIEKIKEKLLINDELLIEFFEGSTHIYIFSISKNKIPRVSLNPKFLPAVEND